MEGAIDGGGWAWVFAGGDDDAFVFRNDGDAGHGGGDCGGVGGDGCGDCWGAEGDGIGWIDDGDLEFCADVGGGISVAVYFS